MLYFGYLDSLFSEFQSLEKLTCLKQTAINLTARSVQQPDTTLLKTREQLIQSKLYTAYQSTPILQYLILSPYLYAAAKMHEISIAAFYSDLWHLHDKCFDCIYISQHTNAS